MQVVSLNVGEVQVVPWEGREIRTGFRKRPVRGPVPLRGVNLAGDDQADRTVHGGRQKTVYVYPSEHYPYWQEALEVRSLGWGAFGENLTTSGWLESAAHIGDVVRIGTATLVITQPRFPCYKLNAVFARSDMVQRFQRSGRSGFYLAPVSEGEMGEGNSIELLSQTAGAPAVSEVFAREVARESNPNP
jgi:MOSC domain-containing protein YiiM